MEASGMMDELVKLEREKTQYEERLRQLDEKKDDLAKKLADLGVNVDDLEEEIRKVAARVRQALDSAKDPNFKPAPSSPVSSPITEVHDIAEESLSIEGLDA